MSKEIDPLVSDKDIVDNVRNGSSRGEELSFRRGATFCRYKYEPERIRLMNRVEELERAAKRLLGRFDGLVDHISKNTTPPIEPEEAKTMRALLNNTTTHEKGK